MTHIRGIAAVLLVASAFGHGSASAAQRVEEPGVGQVCLIAYEMCMAACDINSPDSGLGFNEFISNQACKHQCEEALNICTDTGKPSRKLSVRNLTDPTIWGMDGTESTGNSRHARDTTKPPADPGNGKGGDGIFGTGPATGRDTLVFAAD